MKRVLVFGGTGHFGRYIVESLLKKGEQVRVLSRNILNARKILGDKPEIIEGDVTSRDSIIKALQGVRAIIIAISAFSWKTIHQLRLIERDSIFSILEEAKKAGISRVVYISGYDVRKDVLDRLHIKFESARIKIEIERALFKSDFNWTILGAAPSMKLFFALIRGAKMIVPGGGPPAIVNISPVDVGEIAAQTVVRNDLGGKRLRMAGPEALSFPEAANRISKVIARPIKFQKVPIFPLKIASIVLWPFNPYLRHLLDSIKLLNNFPQDIVSEFPEAYSLLQKVFSYQPTTLEMEARRLLAGNKTG
jgi:uncharacterized protein YbjT (DUF2867 family)